MNINRMKQVDGYQMCRNIREGLRGMREVRSTPRTLPCREPYRNKCKPPALVDAFPPIWQLPFAPKCKGIVYRDSPVHTFLQNSGYKNREEGHPFIKSPAQAKHKRNHRFK
jgi:hypothetical protein